VRLHLDATDGLNMVQTITTEQIVINHRVYTSSLIVTPHTTIANWKPRRLTDLSEDDFLPLVELEPDVVLLGTGKQLRFPEPHITKPLIEHAMGIEIMDTPAACRTFNILASEGRKVAAALLFEASGGVSRNEDG